MARASPDRDEAHGALSACARVSAPPRALQHWSSWLPRVLLAVSITTRRALRRYRVLEGRCQADDVTGVTTRGRGGRARWTAGRAYAACADAGPLPPRAAGRLKAGAAAVGAYAARDMAGVVRTGAATLVAVHLPEDPTPTAVARQAIAVPGAAVAAIRDPRCRKRVRRGDARHERRADRGGGSGEPDAPEYLAPGDATAVGRHEAPAGADDERGLQQAEALELGHGVEDVRFADV